VELKEVWQVAKENDVSSNDVIDACRDLGISATRVASKLRPDQVKRLESHFAGKRQYVSRGRSVVATPSKRPLSPGSNALPVPDALPVLKLRPRAAALWNVSEVAEIPPVPEACACCGIRYPRPHDDRAQQYCPRCRAHYSTEGEQPDRELARLRDHEQRLRQGYAAAWHHQGHFEGRMKSAMHSRDRWKAALAEVVLTHEETEDGSCKACHEQTFPCGTWRKLEEANRGIHRKVEALWGLPEDELERALYGDDDDYQHS
jgi:hypothetical protein